MGLSHSPSIVTNGLINYVDAANSRCYSGTGVTAFDAIKNTALSMVGGIGYSSAKLGSFVFDNTGRYIILPTIDTNESCTFSFWNRRNATGAIQNLLHGIEGVAQNYFQIRYDTTNYVQLVKSGVFNIGSFTNYTAPANTDIYLTVVYSKPAALYYLYINGVYQGSVSYISTSFVTTRPVLGSGYAFAENFNGLIYSFSYYNRVLTAAEILKNYDATKRRFGLS
jgi:hypothetical protein